MKQQMIAEIDIWLTVLADNWSLDKKRKDYWIRPPT